MNQEISIVTLALAAGATMALRPNRLTIPKTEQSLYDAYDALRATIEERHPSVTVDLLDIAPDSIERQQELDAQLRRSGAVEDKTVQLAVDALLKEIAKHAPEAAAAVGLNIAN